MYIKILHFYQKITTAKFIFCIAFCILSLSSTTAQESEKGFTGFSGGMMIHSGYMWGNDFQITDNQNNTIAEKNVPHVPFGIGGALRLHFGAHFRLGMDGGVTTLSNRRSGQRWQLGFGNILAEGTWSYRNFLFFVGGSIGGGGVRNMVLLSANDQDYQLENQVLYRKYGVLLVTPAAGFEYALSSRMHLICKVDCAFNLLYQKDFAMGPRVYLGFIFVHAKKK